MTRWVSMTVVCLLVAIPLALAPSHAAEKEPAKAKTTDEKKPAKPKIVIDEKNKTVTVPAIVAEQGKHAEQLKGAIEYALVSTGGKDYETVFSTGVPAEEIQAALVKVGAKVGKPADEESAPKGTAVKITVAYTIEGKKPVRKAIDEFIAYAKTGRQLKAKAWTFTGSTLTVDPETETKVLQAKLTQSVIGLHYGDRSSVFQNPRKECRTENIYKANAAALPPAGTKVSIIFAPQLPKVPKGVVRVHVFLTGRVQGVGFRAFTVRKAKGIGGLTGWVRNLRDGRVEAIIEGAKEKVDQLLEHMKTGPRAARVDKMDTKDETPEGKFKSFTRLN
jgi:acylphosphatase